MNCPHCHKRINPAAMLGKLGRAVNSDKQREASKRNSRLKPREAVRYRLNDTSFITYRECRQVYPTVWRDKRDGVRVLVAGGVVVAREQEKR